MRGPGRSPVWGMCVGRPPLLCLVHHLAMEWKQVRCSLTRQWIPSNETSSPKHLRSLIAISANSTGVSWFRPRKSRTCSWTSARFWSKVPLRKTEPTICDGLRPVVVFAHLAPTPCHPCEARRGRLCLQGKEFFDRSAEECADEQAAGNIRHVMNFHVDAADRHRSGK